MRSEVIQNKIVAVVLIVRSYPVSGDPEIMVFLTYTPSPRKRVHVSFLLIESLKLLNGN